VGLLYILIAFSLLVLFSGFVWIFMDLCRSLGARPLRSAVTVMTVGLKRDGNQTLAGLFMHSVDAVTDSRFVNKKPSRVLSGRQRTGQFRNNIS
jgi:hypothetical protein